MGNDESQELHSYIAGQNVTVCHPKWIKLGPMFLKKFAYGNEDLYPIFGKIADLYALSSDSSGITQYTVKLQKCITQYYDSHFGEYVVKLYSTFVIHNLSTLPLFPVLHSHKAFSQSKFYIVLKQFLN